MQILCPIDFSDASINALEYAVRIGEMTETSVHLIHVVTPEEYSDNLSKDAEAIDHVDEAPAKKLENLVQAINTDETFSLSSLEVLEGELIGKLKAFISKKGISLVVMGTEGVHSVGEAWMGSNTIKLIEETDIPVLCIPKSSSYSKFKNIIYGTDFSSKDKNLLQPVLSFALPWDARTTVVHIAKSEFALLNEGYSDYVKEMESYFLNDKLSFEQFITDDEPHIALEHILNDHHADLLVLVHKKRNFLQSLFHRSLTKKMSYMTNFPLLVFRN